MPDWNLFWEQVWIGICCITYVVLLLAFVAGFFALVIFAGKWLIEFGLEWWDDLQDAKRAAERESLYKQIGGPW